MQGARRRAYVDMVKEGNAAADRLGRNPVGGGAAWTIAGMNACLGAHGFVGSPRNIGILLRALLLDLHPTSPPSHTCLVMKQVLDILDQRQRDTHNPRGCAVSLIKRGCEREKSCQPSQVWRDRPRFPTI